MHPQQQPKVPNRLYVPLLDIAALNIIERTLEVNRPGFSSLHKRYNELSRATGELHTFNRVFPAVRRAELNRHAQIF